MRICTLYRGKHTVYDRPAAAVVVGRPKLGVPVDIDLTPDELSSRPHARIAFENGQWWIEDLGSRRGTKVDGREIGGLGKYPLTPENVVRIGATVLRVESHRPAPEGGAGPEDGSETWRPPDEGGRIAFDQSTPGGGGRQPRAPMLPTSGGRKRSDDLSISIVVPPVDPIDPTLTIADTSAAARRQAVLYELLLGFGSDEPLDAVLERALEGLVSSIPAAERGAILTLQPKSDKLLLRAHLPRGEPAVSETLAERAMSRREGFVWEREHELSVSQVEYRMASGMYAPMVWKGESFGVICVDNSTSSRGFDGDDLNLLVAAAQHAALAIANSRLCEELQSNVTLIERLLTNFSPAIRQRLLAKARGGRLRLGGEKSEVTVLASDIRGFTRLTANMDAEDVVDMLNNYFSALVEAIFEHDGTVDKFIGDAILAVFGSPEPDPDHHANAVRAALAMQKSLAEVNAARGRGAWSRARWASACIAARCCTGLSGRRSGWSLRSSATR